MVTIPVELVGGPRCGDKVAWPEDETYYAFGGIAKGDYLTYRYRRESVSKAVFDPAW